MTALILPPMPYTPVPFRRGALADVLTVYYHWRESVSDELRASMDARPDGYAGWLEIVEEPLSRVIDRIEVRHAGQEETRVYRLPGSREERISWLQSTFPPRLLGEICGAILSGTYDSGELVGKS